MSGYGSQYDDFEPVNEYIEWQTVCIGCKYFMNTNTMQKCMWFSTNRDVEWLFDCPISDPVVSVKERLNKLSAIEAII